MPARAGSIERHTPPTWPPPRFLARIPRPCRVSYPGRCPVSRIYRGPFISLLFWRAQPLRPGWYSLGEYNYNRSVGGISQPPTSNRCISSQWGPACQARLPTLQEPSANHQGRSVMSLIEGDGSTHWLLEGRSRVIRSWRSDGSRSGGWAYFFCLHIVL